ncbi:MAG TPA: molybdopterin-dependent oxidoreductase [Caulobacteraceae bacterium]|nr:molybdopterin-dependent oxidoreductase [Caulobacteraceae bacterium]
MRLANILLTAGVLGLFAWAVVGGAVAQSVNLRGPDGQTRTVTLADLAAMPHQSATLASEHGPAKRYDGVPLTTLLQSVGAPAGKTLRGPALADLVVVSASDGYRVVLGLAETDAGVRPEKILLADRVEGAPLPPTEGPFRLVIEGDLRPVRSARMVTAIRVEAAP